MNKHVYNFRVGSQVPLVVEEDKLVGDHGTPREKARIDDHVVGPQRDQRLRVESTF